MTLYQMKIFEAVARHSNITQASSELHLSQPAVSQQLKLLEEHYGTVLLVRHSHGVKLTDKGRAFLEAITPVLGQLDEIEQRFKGNRKRKSSEFLAIGGSNSISVRVLPNLLKAFRESHPTVEFSLASNDSSVIEKQLLKSELDIAVLTNPSQNEALVYEPFECMEVIAVCLPTNPVAGKTLTLKELAEYPLVLKNQGRIETVLTSGGYKTNCALRCEVSQAVKGAVQAGLGIGILYRNAVATALANGSLQLINVPELTKMGINALIAYDARKPLSLIAQEFLTLLRERTNRLEKSDDQTLTITAVKAKGKMTGLETVSTKTARKYPLPHHPSAV